MIYLSIIFLIIVINFIFFMGDIRNKQLSTGRQLWGLLQIGYFWIITEVC